MNFHRETARELFSEYTLTHRDPLILSEIGKIKRNFQHAFKFVEQPANKSINVNTTEVACTFNQWCDRVSQEFRTFENDAAPPITLHQMMTMKRIVFVVLFVILYAFLLSKYTGK